jgi:low temperature requirement protein LtrA
MLDEAAPNALVDAPVEREQRVTALELFFDLVFVFAITQVTGFLYHDPTWGRLVEALAMLMVLWFAWTAYAWLGNTAASDEGAIRIVLLAAMAPLLIASLAVPNAFGKDALAFGVAYFLVRALHILAYGVLARGNPEPGAPSAGVSHCSSTTAGSCSVASRAGAWNRRTSRSVTA